MMFLPDINVWLALAFAQHSDHDTAKAWFEQALDGGCSFCRMTQHGFLRIATNPNVFGKETLSLREAWVQYDRFLDDPRVVFAEEPAGLEKHWRACTRRRSFSRDVWSDAYLAAFAKAARLKVVSFDRGFAQYKNVTSVILRSP